MPHGIGFRGGTDVAALDIADNHQILFLTVIHSFLVSDHAFDPELLIHGDLRLYRGNQVVNRIHNPLVVLPDGLSRSL